MNEDKREHIRNVEHLLYNVVDSLHASLVVLKVAREELAELRAKIPLKPVKLIRNKITDKERQRRRDHAKKLPAIRKAKKLSRIFEAREGAD